MIIVLRRSLDCHLRFPDAKRLGDHRRNVDRPPLKRRRNTTDKIVGSRCEVPLRENASAEIITDVQRVVAGKRYFRYCFDKARFPRIIWIPGITDFDGKASPGRRMGSKPAAHSIAVHLPRYFLVKSMAHQSGGSYRLYDWLFTLQRPELPRTNDGNPRCDAR